MNDEFNITSAQYVRAEPETENTCIEAVINGVRLLVPFDDKNVHYAAILEWASQPGNSIADAD